MLLGALLGTDGRDLNFDLPILPNPSPDSIPNRLFAFLLRKKAGMEKISEKIYVYISMCDDALSIVRL